MQVYVGRLAEISNMAHVSRELMTMEVTELRASLGCSVAYFVVLLCRFLGSDYISIKAKSM